jgi:hypothetical protein
MVDGKDDNLQPGVTRRSSGADPMADAAKALADAAKALSDQELEDKVLKAPAWLGDLSKLYDDARTILWGSISEDKVSFGTAKEFEEAMEMKLTEWAENDFPIMSQGGAIDGIARRILDVEELLGDELASLKGTEKAEEAKEHLWRAVQTMVLVLLIIAAAVAAVAFPKVALTAALIVGIAMVVGATARKLLLRNFLVQGDPESFKSFKESWGNFSKWYKEKGFIKAYGDSYQYVLDRPNEVQQALQKGLMYPVEMFQKGLNVLIESIQNVPKEVAHSYKATQEQRKLVAKNNEAIKALEKVQGKLEKILGQDPGIKVAANQERAKRKG